MGGGSHVPFAFDVSGTRHVQHTTWCLGRGAIVRPELCKLAGRQSFDLDLVSSLADNPWGRDDAATVSDSEEERMSRTSCKAASWPVAGGQLA